MKKFPVILILSLLLFVGVNVYAEKAFYLTSEVLNDTTKSKETKKKKRELERIQLRHSHSRFSIKFGYVYAFLDTKVSFDLPEGNLSTTLSLEQNLGLPGKSLFFTGSFLYRITPRSGIYTQYYGINRSESSQTDKDYSFKTDTIPAGTDINAHFNTQVISTGYLLSILRDPDAFLGFYFNVYLMFLETGVNSEIGSINENVEFVAPLPNFGLIASFKLTKWLYLNGGVGFFSLHTSYGGGSLYNFDISLMARPVRWLGINLSYQEFDVRVDFPMNDVYTVIDYNFRGPSVGLSFFF